MLWYVYYGVCIEGGSNAKKRLVMQEACMGGSGGGQLKEKEKTSIKIMLCYFVYTSWCNCHIHMHKKLMK